MDSREEKLKKALDRGYGYLYELSGGDTHYEELNRYGQEHWECKDCGVMLNSDGICPSCGFTLEY